LTGRVVEGRRWLDDAFAARGEVDEQTRALALTGRGLLEFLAGATERSDDDLATALQIFERHGDVESMVLANSFYAEQAAVRGDLDEARRRRQAMLDLYALAPEDPFASAGRVYSLAKLAILDEDLVAAERHYRSATEQFGRLDRPVMSSMCLGMVADFDERAGDFPAAIATLEAAIATNDALLAGFTGSLHARLCWALLCDGQPERAEVMGQRALDSARRVRHAMVIFQAQAALSVVHRRGRRDDAAVDAASEALELYRQGGFHRFRNRIDATADLRMAAAMCCDVLAVIAAERGEPDRSAAWLGQAGELRDGTGLVVPALLQEDGVRAREIAITALDRDGFLAAFDRGRRASRVAPAS
jgi:tetratricopeptide (TPR) repeat protein